MYIRLVKLSYEASASWMVCAASRSMWYFSYCIIIGLLSMVDVLLCLSLQVIEQLMISDCPRAFVLWLPWM